MDGEELGIGAEVERAVEAGPKVRGLQTPTVRFTSATSDRQWAGLRLGEVDTPVVDRLLDATQHETVSGARTTKLASSGMIHLAARHGAVAVNPVREVGQIKGTQLRHDPRSLPRAQAHRPADRRGLEKLLDPVRHDPESIN